MRKMKIQSSLGGLREFSGSPIVVLLTISVAVSALRPQLAEADIFQDTIPYTLDGDLRAYLAKRGLINEPFNEPTELAEDRQRQQQALADQIDGQEQEPEVYLLEDKDYPESVFESYPGAGQVSGLTALPSGDIAIFHRAAREWSEKTFLPNNSISEPVIEAQDNLIKNNTIMIIDGETGNSKVSFGANLFYMPHGVASDSRGNLWVTDVARHQVMRLPASMIHLSLIGANLNGSQAREQWLPGHLARLWPDIILGEAFVPGEDEAHFCKPSEVAISSDDRLVFVADGYCNSRVVVFTGEGKYLGSFGEGEGIQVVHSLSLIEERNLICAADRENGRIICFKAGLDGDLRSLGEPVLRLNYPIGRVFALAQIDSDHLLVSGNQFETSKFDLAILNPFRSTIKQVWTSSDLLNPHSLARTKDGRYIYAADMSRDAYKKVFRFSIIREQSP